MANASTSTLLNHGVSVFLREPGQMLIEGRWMEAASGKSFNTYNPATGESLQTVPEGDREDIHRAVKAALEQKAAGCITKRAFGSQGLESAWERVIVVVAQPGVEYGDASVFAYDAQKARELSNVAVEQWHGVYEAHSTHDQPAGTLREMVLDHFAILKVAQWLTIAFREALFALAAVEQEWLTRRSGVTFSQVREKLDCAMVENLSFWRDYYHGEESALRLARKYSYGGRSRYYWPQPKGAAALDQLIANLTAYPPAHALLSQSLPIQSELVRERKLDRVPGEMIRSKIREVLRAYRAACGSKAEEKASC